MSVLGVVIVPNAKHPRVHAVVLDGTLDGPTVVDTFELRTAAVNPSEQAVDLARLLSAKITDAMTASGIRIAGTTPVARRNRAAFSRAHCEGAVLFVLREAIGAPVATVVPLTAPTTVGIKRSELDVILGSVTSSGANPDAVLAAVAALAAS